MKKKCKHLIVSTKGWPTELIEGCYQFEVYVEKLENVDIVNSWSDYQPSYLVKKIEGGRRYDLIIELRIRKGKVRYFVQDYINKLKNLMNTLPKGDSISFDVYQLGSNFHPYDWDFETLKEKIENIDMNDGYVFNRQG